jgi:hypothetical protein
MRTPNNFHLTGLKAILVSLFIITLTACGGGGGGSDPDSGGGELIGTGFSGKTALGAAIANAEIRIKSLSGRSIVTTSNANGDFTSSEISETNANTQRGPYLLRVDKGNGEFLYSIAHSENAASVDSDSELITINIHPYTDLIIRNWFAQASLDIDSEFNGDGPIDNLPTVTEINNISDEFLSILQNTLEANGAATNTNLLSTPFEINSQGFDGFLDNSQVVINNNIINVVINQPQVSNPIQNTIINNIDLDTDFTSDNDSAPTLPGNVRALPTNVSGEAIIVWDPSTDDKGVASYNIYRDSSLVGSTPFPVFIDMGLTAGINYEYTIEAIDGRDQTSGQTSVSPESSITLDQPDNTAPPSATNLQVIDANGIASLTWTQSNIDDVVGFTVYRGAPGNVNLTTPLTSITSTMFNDFDVVASTTYCYRIVTFDAAGNESAPTAESCVTISGVTTESTVAFSSSTYSVQESAGSISITVNRSGDLSEAISVDYAATAGSATAGIDFVETSGTLNWSASDSTARTFAIQITENSEVENDETVNIELSNPSSNLINGTDSAVLTIIDAPQVACIDLTPTVITTNTTLSEPCYNVNSNIFVRDTATLTVSPGVRLQFAQGVSLDVEADGILSAIGTAQAPIIFTGALPAAGYWDGIDIGSIALSRLDYVIIEYGGNDTAARSANISLYGSGSASLTNSTIRHSADFGVVSTVANAQFSTFENNNITLNENAPVQIRVSQVGSLDSMSSYTGNITSVGGNRDYIDVFGTDIDVDQTWNLLDVNYHMPTGITDIQAVLSIAPGVTLLFPANAGLDIETTGTLSAVGTAVQPVTFTGMQQTPGYWRGLQFTFSNNANELDHTIVEYGGGAGGNTTANVGVFGTNSLAGRLSISNSTLRHSASYGFEFDDDTDLTMANVTSTNNNQPGIIGFNEAGLLDNASSYSGNTDDRILLSSSNSFQLTRAQTIPNVGVPYFATEADTVQVQSSLTIEAGVEIQFNAGGGFNVQSTGTLIAQGSPTSPVILTGAQQTPGYWNGIQFTFSNNPNLIDNAIIEYAGAPSGNTEGLVGFFGSGSLASNGNVTNSILRFSQTNGVWVDTDTTGDFSTGNTFENITGSDIFIDP